MYFPLLLCLLSLTEISAKTIGKCPSNCVCDSYQKLRRLKCANRKLVNIVEDIPQKVQVLDVSYNYIQEIGDHGLLALGLTSVKIFNISHNMLGHIHLNGFRGMDRLKTIDLSHNVLEYLLFDWFYDLTDLKELYLNNNNFASLPEGPLIESNFLQKLDLSNSRIPHIKKDAFVKLPSLQKLYLDGNSLIQLNPITLSSLQSLQLVSLENNPLNCDKSTSKLKEFLRKLNVIYKDSCEKKINELDSEKFQRMIKLPENDPPAVNTWILDEEIEDDVSVTYNCTRTNDVNRRKGILLEIIELSPILAVLTPFFVGIVLGLILGCTIQIKPQRSRKGKPRTRYSIIRRNQSDFNPLVLNCENIFESTPVPQRRFIESNPL